MNRMPGGDNFHATAIVVGTTGLLFVGPSGAGKSARAFACLDAARARGSFTALVADDQVLLSRAGTAIIAAAPAATAGLIELRGSGIVRQAFLPRAVLHFAVMLSLPGEAPRLPDDGERFSLGRTGCLPSMRLGTAASDLAAIDALAARLPGFGGFSATDPSG